MSLTLEQETTLRDDELNALVVLRERCYERANLLAARLCGARENRNRVAEALRISARRCVELERTKLGWIEATDIAASGNVEVKNAEPCESCNDTGWCGDNGPGIRGNREYYPCEDCTAVERAQRTRMGEVGSRQSKTTVVHGGRPEIQQYLNDLRAKRGTSTPLLADEWEPLLNLVDELAMRAGAWEGPSRTHPQNREK